MKWFDNWFAKKSKEVWERAAQKDSVVSSAIAGANFDVQKAIALSQNIKINSNVPTPNTQCINFQIYPATGGHVVEVSFTDPMQAHINGYGSNKSLHIIPSSEDLGQAISKIITLEMLKK